MKIAIEKRIPYITAALTAPQDLLLLEAHEFTREVLSEVDVIIIRTTVRCDADLLEESSVKLILTATIGYDHIDTDYCRAKGIVWKNAPGCNADGVVQYFLSALAASQKLLFSHLHPLTVGIIGYGNVGRRVADVCQSLGMKTIVNDPPLQENGATNSLSRWATWEEVAQEADVITIHTPLTHHGDHPTYHLINEAFFDKCLKKPLIINAARGGVVDEKALIEAYREGQVEEIVIDCWEGEPTINLDLLKASAIHTPHIAGYSADGKANASRMCLENLQAFGYNSIDLQKITLPQPVNSRLELQSTLHDQMLAEALLLCYDIRKDSDRLALDPHGFRRQRDQYIFRREAKAYTVVTRNADDVGSLIRLGFQIEKQ